MDGIHFDYKKIFIGVSQLQHYNTFWKGIKIKRIFLIHCHFLKLTFTQVLEVIKKFLKNVYNQGVLIKSTFEGYNTRSNIFFKKYYD